MAWIYLAESEESDLPWNHGSEQSPIVKTTDTPKPFCFQRWPRAYCLLPRYGMMSGVCGEITCQELTSSPADSLARTSALRALERAWEASGPASSLRLSDSLASFDRDSFSWKTSQLSLFGGLTEFSWSSLRWGSIVDGRLYQPQRWEPRTCGNAGSFLPTPTATDYGSNNHGVKEGKAESKGSLGQMARRGMFPTPMASDGDKSGNDPETLVGAVRDRWPTPRASERGQYQRDRGEKGKERPTLTGRALGYPTPQARDGKDGSTPRPHGRNSPSVAVAVAADGHKGFLNPQFVEVLMGFPIEWTVLEDWATQWFRSKRGKRSKDLLASKAVTPPTVKSEGAVGEEKR